MHQDFVWYIIMCVWRVKFTQAARKHRIGRAAVLEALRNAGDPSTIPADDNHDMRYLYVGVDDRNRELEIIAVPLPDTLLIIHVMPTTYRR